MDTVKVLSRPKSATDTMASQDSPQAVNVTFSDPAEAKRTQPPTEPRVMIMKRPSLPRDGSVPGAAALEETQEKTLEQREAEYEKARSRILRNSNSGPPSPTSTPTPTCTPTPTTTAPPPPMVDIHLHQGLAANGVWYPPNSSANSHPAPSHPATACNPAFQPQFAPFEVPPPRHLHYPPGPPSPYHHHPPPIYPQSPSHMMYPPPGSIVHPGHPMMVHQRPGFVGHSHFMPSPPVHGGQFRPFLPYGASYLTPPSQHPQQIRGQQPKQNKASSPGLSPSSSPKLPHTPHGSSCVDQQGKVNTKLPKGKAGQKNNKRRNEIAPKQKSAMSDNDWRSTAAETNKILLANEKVPHSSKKSTSESANDLVVPADDSHINSDNKKLSPVGSQGSLSSSGRSSPAPASKATTGKHETQKNGRKSSKAAASVGVALDYLRAREDTHVEQSQDGPSSSEDILVVADEVVDSFAGIKTDVAVVVEEASKAARKRKNKKQKKRIQALQLAETGWDRAPDAQNAKRRSAVADVSAYTRDTNKAINKRILRMPKGPDASGIGFNFLRTDVRVVSEVQDVETALVVQGVEKLELDVKLENLKMEEKDTDELKQSQEMLEEQKTE